MPATASPGPAGMRLAVDERLPQLTPGSENRDLHASQVDLNLSRREDRVGDDQRIQRLPQPSARQRLRPRHIVSADEHDLHVTIELQMLKPVVEHVDGRAEVLLGKRSGEISIFAYEHARAWQLSREHQRLVAGAWQIGANAVRIADDDDAVVRILPRVAAAQDRRTLPHLEQQARDAGGDRRLAPATDGEVPDTDDRMPQPLSQIGPRAVPLAPPSRERCVEGTDHRRCVKTVVRDP